MNQILQAARFAATCHDGQLRKYTGVPYITHPARVAARTMLLPQCTEEMVCAAWLHDVLEDCQSLPGMPGLVKQIQSTFGDEVLRLVSWLTNPSKGSSAARAERKKMDREHLAQAPSEAQLIKLVDRLDNIMELTGAPTDFIILYCEETEQLLDSIGSADGSLACEIRAVINRWSSR